MEQLEEQYDDEEYEIEVKMVNIRDLQLFDIIFWLVITPITILLYYTFSQFRAFIGKNIEYIYSELDTLLIYQAVKTIFWLYFAISVISLIKGAIKRLTFYDIRVAFAIVKRNAQIWVMAAIILSLLFNRRVLDPVCYVLATILIVILNLHVVPSFPYQFIDYTPLRKEQHIFERVRNKTKFEFYFPYQVMLTVLFWVLLIVLAIVYNYGDATIRQSLDWFYTNILSYRQDLPLFLLIYFLLSFGWIILSCSINAFYYLFKKKEDLLIKAIKILIMIIFVYFAIKLVIFNVAEGRSTPMTSFYSLALSGVGSLVMKLGMKVIKKENIFSRNESM